MSGMSDQLGNLGHWFKIMCDWVTDWVTDGHGWKHEMLVHLKGYRKIGCTMCTTIGWKDILLINLWTYLYKKTSAENYV